MHGNSPVRNGGHGGGGRCRSLKVQIRGINKRSSIFQSEYSSAGLEYSSAGLEYSSAGLEYSSAGLEYSSAGLGT